MQELLSFACKPNGLLRGTPIGSFTEKYPKFSTTRTCIRKSTEGLKNKYATVISNKFRTFVC